MAIDLVYLHDWCGTKRHRPAREQQCPIRSLCQQDRHDNVDGICSVDKHDQEYQEEIHHVPGDP